MLYAVRIHLHRAGSAGDIARDGDVRPGSHAQYRRKVERLATSACGVPESQLFAGQENLERIVLADQVLSVGNQPVRVEPERHRVGRQTVQQARVAAEVIVGAVKMDGIRVVYQAQQRRVVGAGDRELDVLCGRVGRAVVDFDGIGDGQALANTQEVQIHRTRVVAVANAGVASVGGRTRHCEDTSGNQVRSACGQRERSTVKQHRRAAHHAGCQGVCVVQVVDRKAAADRVQVLR